MKRVMMIALAALFLSGCASSLFITIQIDKGPITQTPIGNATKLDVEVLVDAWLYGDKVLPNWLHGTLTTIAVAIDLPFSLIFDIVTSPYQIIVHYTREKPKDGGTE